MKGHHFLAFILIASSTTHSEILFESNFEGEGSGAIPYIQGTPTHPGGGYITFLGGEIRDGTLNPGDGDDHYGSYNNVVLDNSAAARNSTTGSNYALKTHYKEGSAHSYQLNTTIIKFPPQDDFYVRWYQKWSEAFVWPQDQQKLIKIKGEGSSQNFPITGSRNNIHLTYNRDGETDQQTYVYSDWWGWPSESRRSDSVEDNENFLIQTNRWYCIEIRVKSNTPGQSDAEFAYWIDDSLKLRLSNASNRGNSTAGVETIELQHVYQSNSPPAVDQPTWMDDIVLSTERIGCVPGSEISPPKSPKNLSGTIN